MDEHKPRVLLTGATGFVGGRLLPNLVSNGFQVRCLVRSASGFAGSLPPEIKAEPVEGDLLKPGTWEASLDGMDVAFYLVHSMGGRNFSEIKSFAERDQKAATHFLKAAEAAGLSRIIYLGGLGELGDSLSEHLASRQEVGRILQSGKVRTTVLRAANIVGAGGAPFEMLRYMVERVPVMICPRWVDTPCQPIAISNVVDYLAGCLQQEDTAGLSFDIGGPDIISYRELMLIYARVRGLRRLVVTVPVLTPRLSAYWINLMTPVPAGVIMPLVEGLRNTVVCRENRIRELVPVRLVSMEEAVCTALTETRKGPGRLPSTQACFRRL